MDLIRRLGLPQREHMRRRRCHFRYDLDFTIAVLSLVVILLSGKEGIDSKLGNPTYLLPGYPLGLILHNQI